MTEIESQDILTITTSTWDDHEIREKRENGVLTEIIRTDWGKYGLTRVFATQPYDEKFCRYYWFRLRVPWIVWAMFS